MTYDKPFGDFVLKCDVKQSDPCNSGIFLRIAGAPLASFSRFCDYIPFVIEIFVMSVIIDILNLPNLVYNFIAAANRGQSSTGRFQLAES